MMTNEPYGSTTASEHGGKADAAKAAASDTAHAAKDQASGLARSAKESGQHLAGEAKHEARGVTREARQQAGSLLGQGRDELTRQASEQQHKLAGGLRSFGSELGAMADGSGEAGEEGLATDLTRRLADGTDAAATWLDEREPGDLLAEVKRFARNRPGTFLAIAAGAGLLAGRLARGVKDAHADDDGSDASSRSADAHQAATAGVSQAATAGVSTGTYGTAAGDPTGGVERRSVSEGYPGAPSRSTLGAPTGSRHVASEQPTQRLDTGPAHGTGDTPTPGVDPVEGRPWIPVEGEGEQR